MESALVVLHDPLDALPVGTGRGIVTALAAVEALNLMNEVEAPINGTVVELPLKDGQAVEYGQSLVVIKP